MAPKFGNVRMKPIEIKEFQEWIEKEFDVSFGGAGDVIIEYQKYLIANEFQHHYGENTQEQWLILQITKFVENFSKN